MSILRSTDDYIGNSVLILRPKIICHEPCGTNHSVITIIGLGRQMRPGPSAIFQDLMVLIPTRFNVQPSELESYAQLLRQRSFLIKQAPQIPRHIDGHCFGCCNLAPMQLTIAEPAAGCFDVPAAVLLHSLWPNTECPLHPHSA